MAKLVPWSKSRLEKGEIPVAIISLPDATSRRETLIDRGVPVDLVNEFWPACDMRFISDLKLRSYTQYDDIKELYGRAPISAELGCYFSHSAVVKWFSEQDYISQLVVFEDDIIPESCNSFEILNNLASSLVCPADLGKSFICHLGPRPLQWKYAFVRRISKRSVDISGLDLFELVDKRACLWRAHAYIISKGVAHRHVTLSKKTGFIADDWRFIKDQTMTNLMLVNPPLFVQDEGAVSMIDPENIRKKITEGLPHWKALAGIIYMYKKIGREIKRLIKTFIGHLYKCLPGKNLY